MGLPRFILSLAVSLALAIVGAQMTYSGGTALVRTAALYPPLEKSAGITGTTFCEALNPTGQTALSFSDAIVPTPPCQSRRKR